MCGSRATAKDGMATVLAVQSLSGSGQRLEPPKELVLRLLTMLGTQAWERDAASRLIAYDKRFSAKIMRAANSATTSTLGSADAAVSRMGPAKVVALAVADWLHAHYSTALPAFGLAADQLWRHSVATALAVERLQRQLSQPLPNECLAAAMLHELGYLVLAHTLPLDVQAVLASPTKQGWTRTREAERELTGTDHGGVGGAIANHWGFPQVFVDTIAFHHAPNQIPTAHHAHVAHVVNLADMVASTIGESLGQREANPVDEAGSMVKLSLSGAQFSALCQEVFDDLEDGLYWYS